MKKKIKFALVGSVILVTLFFLVTRRNERSLSGVLRALAPRRYAAKMYQVNNLHPCNKRLNSSFGTT